MSRGSVFKQSRGLPSPRRQFSRLLLGLLIATPRVAMTRGPTAARRIGLLPGGAPSTPETMGEALRLLRENPVVLKPEPAPPIRSKRPPR